MLHLQELRSHGDTAKKHLANDFCADANAWYSVVTESQRVGDFMWSATWLHVLNDEVYLSHAQLYRAQKYNSHSTQVRNDKN